MTAKVASSLSCSQRIVFLPSGEEVGCGALPYKDAAFTGTDYSAHSTICMFSGGHQTRLISCCSRAGRVRPGMCARPQRTSIVSPQGNV